MRKTTITLAIVSMLATLTACNQVAGCTNDAPHATPKTAVVRSVDTDNSTTTEHFEYFVSGTNLHTNERVIGWLTAKPGASTVRGVIYDRADRWTVLGHFSGKGQFHLTSLTSTYSVSVVPEVSGDKRLNAKLAK
jgi:predicted small secreted protein